MRSWRATWSANGPLPRYRLPLASQQRRWKPSSSANDGPPTARYDLQLLPSQVDRTSLEHPCESFWLLARLEVSRRTIGRRAEKRVSCTLSVEARAAANPMGERDAVARRGGAVRRAGPNGGPALLAGQANRGRGRHYAPCHLDMDSFQTRCHIGREEPRSSPVLLRERSSGMSIFQSNHCGRYALD